MEIDLESEEPEVEDEELEGCPSLFWANEL